MAQRVPVPVLVLALVIAAMARAGAAESLGQLSVTATVVPTCAIQSGEANSSPFALECARGTSVVFDTTELSGKDPIVLAQAGEPSQFPLGGSASLRLVTIYF